MHHKLLYELNTEKLVKCFKKQLKISTLKNIKNLNSSLLLSVNGVKANGKIAG